VQRTGYGQTRTNGSCKPENLCFGASFELTALEDLAPRFLECCLALLPLVHDRPGTALDFVATLERLRVIREESEVSNPLKAVRPHEAALSLVPSAESDAVFTPLVAHVVPCVFFIHDVPLLSKPISNCTKAHLGLQVKRQLVPHVPRFHGAPQWLSNFEKRAHDELVLCWRCLTKPLGATPGFLLEVECLHSIADLVHAQARSAWNKRRNLCVRRCLDSRLWWRMSVKVAQGLGLLVDVFPHWDEPRGRWEAGAESERVLEPTRYQRRSTRENVNATPKGIVQNISHEKGKKR
jgi:hypothetical protein